MKKTILILLYFLLTTLTVHAQQTVFNAPSADVTPKKKYFLQLEEQFKPYKNNAFANGTIYNCYGIGKNTELNVTIFNANAPSTHNISMGTGFKSAIPIPYLKNKFPKREYKFTVGSLVLTSFKGQGAGNWTYAHLSGRVPKINTRVSSGVSYGTEEVFGSSQATFMGIIEQPVNEKLTLQTEWYSGNEHFLGYWISGFNYKLPNDQAIIVGYQIPNSSKVGQSGFVVQYSKLF